MQNSVNRSDAPLKRESREETSSLPGNKHTAEKKNDFLLQPPQINLPKGGGAIKSIDEKFSVNAVNGTATCSIGLPFSSARSFSPSLELSYNSGTGNGLFGVGWSLSLSSIHRKTEKELPRYADAESPDTYVLTGAEDLVPELKTDEAGEALTDADGNFIINEFDLTFSGSPYHIRRYRPRIDSAFARIERWHDQVSGSLHWRVITSSNTTTIYGKSPAARVADPGDDNKIFEWLPELMYDDKGNCAVYEYKKEDAAGIDTRRLHNKNRSNGNALFTNTYLKRIRYGNVIPFNTHSDPQPAQYMFETVLDYGEHDPAVIPFNPVKNWDFRADAFSDYRAGFEVRTCRLCKRVLLYHHFAELPGGSSLVKALELNYSNNLEEGFTFLEGVVLKGYTKHDDGTYTQKALPPLSYEYQKHEWNETVHAIAQGELLNAPIGIDDQNYMFVDLFSEGLPGILSEQGNGWFYKKNLGGGKFTEAKNVIPKPSFTGLQKGLQLMDLEANGVKQVVHWQNDPKGFFELNSEEEWLPFKAFDTLPNINFSDANTRLVDLDGNGQADLLLTENDIIRWYPSKGKKGFAAPQTIANESDEERKPAVVFADGTQTIFLADMNGDGLTDIVRIRNGDVAYWPQLGHGKFGSKVSMDNSPFFDDPSLFNPSFVKLADVDGSGTTDIIYHGKNKLLIWLNQHGNSFLPNPKTIDNFPLTDNHTAISVIDLLGNGMACIVWNNTLPQYRHAPLRYINLMNSKKPHILKAFRNNMGKEVLVEYTPSTIYYINDKLGGNPWSTKLHFPVHCVSKVITYDRIQKTRLATEYTYHHGYYDHTEKEFRGFGRVDQKDAEDVDHFIKQNDGAGSEVVRQDLNQHPVLTKTWFHTGAYFENKKLTDQYSREYFQDAVIVGSLLPDIDLPVNLSPEETRGAYRACKGVMLRKEVYALDNDILMKDFPYSVEQHNCVVRRLQPKGENVNGVFITHESEGITCHYERNPADPRIAHNLVFELDRYGNVLQNASVVYPRRPQAGNKPEQEKMHIIFNENEFTNVIQDPLDYRTPLPYFNKSYEISGVTVPAALFKLQTLKTACATASFIDHQVAPTGGHQKRLIEYIRHQYRGNNGLAVLSFGVIESKALLHQSYKAAFNPQLLSAIFSEKISLPGLHADLVNPDKGAYILADNYYWLSSGMQQYDTGHFCLPTSFRNPFGKQTFVEYDTTYFLFIKKITDALGNEVQVSRFNYRVLLPGSTKNINDNLSAVRFDELGQVTRSFVSGKQASNEGDEFDHAKAEMKDAADFPSGEIFYSVDEWYNQSKAPGFDLNNYKPKPNFVRSTKRATHYHDHPLHESKVQESYTYMDGSGNTILTKTQAEPGEALQVNGDGTVVVIPDTSPNLRWAGTGRTILNNKCKPVKKYEPYFSVTPAFDDEKEMVELGVTSVIHYDPAGRVIRTVFPNDTFSKVEFTPWLQKVFDANDTVRDSIWYTRMGSPDPLAAEPANPAERAAWMAAKHHDTATLSHLDSLGRVFTTVTDKGALYLDAGEAVGENLLVTGVKLDIENNELELTDALNRRVMKYFYGMLGNRLKQESMDAGRRWMMTDVGGNPLFSWDDKDQVFSYGYDDLRRPLLSSVKVGAATAIIYQKNEYGEALPMATAKANNLAGVLHKSYDQSGIVTNSKNDFKGNIVRTSKQPARDYKNAIDWTVTANVFLEEGVYDNNMEYDALNRPVKMQMPHITGSPVNAINEIHPSYNEAGLLNKLEVKKRNETQKATFVSNINYNARGQREAVFYGNGTKTAYTYEKETYRLKRLLTTRDNGIDVLQDLNYTFDPVGNITEIKDNSKQDVFFDAEQVKAINKYEFDALYRLVKATGRKHAGQTVLNHTRDDFNYRDHPFIHSNAINPNDAVAFYNYREQYTYDKAGNMKEQRHHDKSGGWVRSFLYNTVNNHLAQTSAAAFSFKYIDTPNGIDYDAHGNMTVMEHLKQLVWNFQDNLSEVDLNGGGRSFYVYDAGGQRVRKVVERLDNTVKDRIYLNGIEIYREKDNAGTTTLERETLHVMDDKQRIALVDTPVVKPAVNNEVQLVRYNYDNHLGSASLELDDTAKVISYEEYFPFGTTSFSTVDAIRETAAKRYRYTGKERDEETGLSYHGTRYYALWLCRWTAADPIGIKDGLNVYTYVKNNPVKLTDPTGTDGEDAPFYRHRSPSLLNPQSYEERTLERLRGTLSPGTLTLSPPAGGALSAPAVAPSATPPQPASSPGASSPATTPAAPASPPWFTISGGVFLPNVRMTFGGRVTVAADTTSTSVRVAIPGGDSQVQLGYRYGGDVSLRLGSTSGSGTAAYNPSTGVGTFSVAGTSGERSPRFESGASVSTAGDVSLTMRFPNVDLGRDFGRVPLGVGYRFNPATGAAGVSVSLGGSLLPTPDALRSTVTLGESRGRAMLTDAAATAGGGLTPASVSGFVSRHSAETPIDPANPAAGTVSDFTAASRAVSAVGSLADVPRRPVLRGGFDFSVNPGTTTRPMDVRVIFQLQVYHY